MRGGNSGRALYCFAFGCTPVHSMARDSIALLCLALHRPIAFQSSQQGRSTKAQRANCFERFSLMRWCLMVIMMFTMILCSLASTSTTTCEAQLISVHCCCYYFFQCSHGGLTRVKLPFAIEEAISDGLWALGLEAWVAAISVIAVLTSTLFSRKICRKCQFFALNL